MNGTYAPVEGQKVQAGAAATTVTFTPAKGTGTKAFFKVVVTDR